MVVQPFSPHGHYRYEASDQSATLQDRENRQGGHTHLVAQAFRKSKRAQTVDDDKTWVDDGLANTLNGFDTGDTRTTYAVAHAFYSTGGSHGVNQTSELCPTLKIGSSLGIPSPPAVAFEPVQVQWASGGGQVENPTVQALRSSAEHNYQFIRNRMVVRRLTPVECERLQGFPDGWTQIGTEDKPTADSHRYKQLGNAVTVNVAEWIGRRAFVWLMK